MDPEKQPIIFFAAIAALVVVVAVLWLFSNKATTTYPTIDFGSAEFPGDWNAMLSAYPRSTGSKVTYDQIAKDSYYTSLVNGLATNLKPDAFIVGSENSELLIDKLEPLDARKFNFRDYPQLVKDAAATKDGSMIGLPVDGEALVVMWNRDLLNSVGVVKPPETWDDLVALVKSGVLTRRGASGQMTELPIAIGSFQNVRRSLEVLLALYLQLGGQPQLLANEGSASPINQDILKRAIAYYTAFSAAKSGNYTWSPNDADDITAFAQERAAMIIAFPSDIPDILALNPRLNFDIAPLFNFSGTKRYNYGRIKMTSVARVSPQKTAAAGFASWLASPQGAATAPRAQGEILLNVNGFGQDVNLKVIENEVLVARSWYFKPDKGSLLRILQDAERSGDYGKVFLNLSVLYQ